MALAIADVLVSLYATRDGYLTALAKDAIDPQPSYSLDGESMDRVTWRKSLTEQLDKLQDLILKYDPFEERTVAL